MTTENGKLLFIFTIRVVFVCSRSFEKAFWQASEADVQDYAHARTSSLRFFCTLLIIITVKRTFVQIGLVQQSSFRYRFSDFGEFRSVYVFWADA